MTARGAVFAVVPVKNPALGKSRLAPALDSETRRALCLELARRTLHVCTRAFGAQRTIVVTAAPDIALLALNAGMHVVTENGAQGLNQAVVLGARRALSEGAGAMLVVPADLALATVEELQAAADAIPPVPGCLIVPDRRGSGTNLLGLAPIREDLFAFGEDSFHRHARIAADAGCEVRLHHSAALSLDLDLPQDYEVWRLSGRRPVASEPAALPL